MLRSSPRPLALVFALVLAFTSAEAAQRRSKPEPAPPPVQFKVDGQTRPMAMQRLVLAVPENVALGKVTILDAQNVFRDVTLSAADFFPGTPTSNYIDAFTREAGLAGYQLAGRQGSSDLFTTADEKSPELIVGAAITGLSGEGSLYSHLLAPDGRMTVKLTVDWQVFDPLEKKLVFRATRETEAKIAREEKSATLPAETALEAFRLASKNILADGEFVSALKGSIQSEAAAPRAQAAPSVEIPRVSLRTTAFREQIPELRHQVVTILTGAGSGSGFYVSDNLIMTNHHVIAGHSRVKIRFYGGREIPGEVVTSDPRRDIALVLAPGGGMMGLPLQFDRPQVGAPVFVIGSPRGQEQEGTVTSGIVSAYRQHEDGPILQSETAINPGNSGGPMFDDKGNVVAVAVSKLNESVGLNFFIPVDDAFRTLGLGVKGVNLAPPQAAQLASAGGRSIQVSMYPAGGPLQKSGKTQAITGTVGGVGTAGTFAFTRPDGVNCDGRWTTLQSKPAAGSLLDKHREVLGIAANPEGMVGGLALGACSNGGSFQAEYYVVPTADSGFGAATDSDGNIYKVIF